MRCLLAVLAVSVAALPASAETLKVAYNQWAGFAHVFVAEEKGFFDEAGVDVELVAFAGPGDSLPPLVAGHLDASLTTPDNVVILEANADTDIRAIWTIEASNGADGIIARNDIKAVKDLEGKRVAVTVGEVNEMLLLKALQDAGMTEDDVVKVNMNPDDAGAAFVAGAVDAAVTWEPWLTQSAEADGHKLYTSKDAPTLLFGDVVAVTQKTIEEKPEALAALLAGIDKGLAYMKANPEEAYALAGKWLDVSGEDVAGYLEGIDIYSRADNVTLLGADGSEPKLATQLAAIAGFLKEQGKIDTLPDTAQLVEPKFLKD